MKPFLILLLLLFCLNLLSSAQGQAQLDSMLKVLSGEKDDSNKVKTLSWISQYYYGATPLKSFPYAEAALQLAEKIKWKKGIANLHNNLGLFICDTGNTVLGRAHYEQSYVLNKELGSKLNIINNLNNIGRSYQSESDFSSATPYFFQALAIAEELKSNEHIALVGTNLASCFLRQKNYSKAIEYGEMTLNYATLAGNSRHKINALMQLGAARLGLNDTVGARHYQEMALKICEETNNRQDLAKVLINISLLDLPDYKKAIATMLRVNTILDEINPSSAASLSNNANLADAWHHLAIQSKMPEKEIYRKKAASCLSRAKALAEQNKTPEMLATILLMQADLEQENGNYKAALEHYKRSTVINDSLFSQEKKNKIAGLEGKHNIAVKDNEIAINKLMLANQRKTQWGLMAGLGLLVIIGALLYWQSRSRKKTNTTLMVLNNQLDEANKVKARFFGILSHDLRSPIVNLVHFLHLQKDNPDLLNENQQAIHRQNISESAEDLLNNMEAMLLWSKEQMENFRPNIKTIPVTDLFGYIQKFFGQTEKVNIIFDAAAGLMVSTDENYLRTIMQNLTSNAIRALKNTPGASIEWKAKREGNKTILSITDNGPGIAAEQAKALFDDSIVNNEKSGLGLHLIRDLAKAIQYKIAVQSEQGKGTTFTLSNIAA